ncbi:hypothetical protein FRC08_005528 [Ceratobasidium sp. 394]|nr:hypothetical protein FRC08_005528 [Ceratobasidium sp. 394]
MEPAPRDIQLTRDVRVFHPPPPPLIRRDYNALLAMPNTNTNAQPSATVPINGKPKPKSPLIPMINNGNTVEIEHPDGTIEHQSMIHKPKNIEVGLEGKLRYGDGQGSDKPHEFYLNMRNQLRLCMRATLGCDYAFDWASVSIKDEHKIMSATKHEYLYFYRFVGDRGAEALLKKTFRNARDTKTNKQGRRKGGGTRHAQQKVNTPNRVTNDEDEDIVEVPPPKQRPAAKSNKPAGKKDKGKQRPQTPEERDQRDDEDDIRPVLTEDEQEGDEGEKEGEKCEEEEPKARPQKKQPLRHVESIESVESVIPSTLRVTSSVHDSEEVANQEESTQATVVLDLPLANPKKRKTTEPSEAAATHAAKKSRTTDNGAPTSAMSDTSLSPPPSPAPSCTANKDAAAAPKGAQKKHDAPDTVEQSAPAKKQKTATKEATTEIAPKETTTGANAATDRTNSWSASYREEVASLPPPPPPKKGRKKAADPPAQPVPGPSDASVPSDPSTSTSKPRRGRPPMRPPPPPDSPPAQTTTRTAKEELVESVEAGAPEPSK